MCGDLSVRRIGEEPERVENFFLLRAKILRGLGVCPQARIGASHCYQYLFTSLNRHLSSAAILSVSHVGCSALNSSTISFVISRFTGSSSEGRLDLPLAPFNVPARCALTQLYKVCSTTPRLRDTAAIVWPDSTSRTASCLNSSV